MALPPLSVRIEGDDSGASRALKRTLGGIVSLTAAIAAARAAIRIALPFDKALAEVSTLIDGTGEMELLRETARRMASEFGGTGTAQVEAFYQAISAGARTVTEATEVLEVSNKLAIGGVTSIVTAVGVLSRATNAYASTNLTAIDAADILFTGVREGVTTIDQLSAALGKTASIAESAGVGFDELIGSVAAMTKSSIGTNEAFTGMKAILAALLKPSDEARKEAKRLTLEFNAAAIESEGLAAFLVKLADATGGSTESLAKLFGGTEALVPILALLSNNAEIFNEVMAAMEGRLGATQTAADKVAASFSKRFALILDQLAVNAEILSTAFFEVLVPAMEFVRDNSEQVGAALLILAATQIPRMIAILASLARAFLATGAAATLIFGPAGLLLGIAAGVALALFNVSKGSQAAKDKLAELAPGLVSIAETFAAVAKAIDDTVIGWRKILGLPSLEFPIEALKQQIAGAIEEINRLDGMIESLSFSRDLFKKGARGAPAAELIPGINEALAADLKKRRELFAEVELMQLRLSELQFPKDPEGDDAAADKITEITVTVVGLGDAAATTAKQLVIEALALGAAADAATEAELRTERLADQMANAVIEVRSLDDALNSLQSILGSVLADMQRGFLKDIFSDLIGSAGALFSGGGGFTAPQGAPLSAGPFAHGGSFTVGGRGGIDSNLVQFMATRGERVEVTPPGQGSSGGNTFFIDATGADQAAIARLESVLRETVGPGKIERRAVSAVVDARMRNPALFGGR